MISHIDEVKVLFTENNPDIFAITETFLDSNVDDCEIEVDNFFIYRHDRNRHGGDVVLYIKNTIPHSKIELCNDVSNNLESVWIMVTLEKRNIAIGCLYRPPSSTSLYHDNILNELEIIGRKHTDFILL